MGRSRVSEAPAVSIPYFDAGRRQAKPLSAAAAPQRPALGTDDATENQPLLDAELRDIVKSVDRVVITGDLFDTPNKNYATLFTTFRNNITHLAVAENRSRSPGTTISE